MSLYTEQESNIRKTWLLFTAFFGIVIGVGYVMSYIWNNQAILFGAVIFSSAMSVVSYWFSDKIVLGMSHAKLVEKRDAPDLYNALENLAITAGLPMPKLYLIDDPSPNAFATGRDPEHAVVAVTTGLLKILDRAELEGVLAHELSHIGNRDMLLSTVAVILVGFVSLVSDMLMRSYFYGSWNRDDDRGRGNVIIILVGIALAILAPLAAQLMQLAISRRREFLADASGAMLTRYPEGLALALEKIGNNKQPVASATNATAHLYFSNPFKNKEGKHWFAKMFMTHPPIEERVQILRDLKI